jgi:multiple sugar transport system ATP-binding protein
VASIRFESVWKHYGDVTAVQNLNLACAEGEMLALLGPSGCGKSSTVKMAAGIEDVSAGEIFFGDRLWCRGWRPPRATSQWYSRITRSTRT